MTAAFLRRHPDLRPFLLSNAQSTGKTIALRSYGSVEEVTIPGAMCAAKKIHDVFLRDSSSLTARASERASEEFVRSCLLISRLRHPHLVQFLGVCFLPGSRLPAIVTEKLLTSLHDVLSPDPPPLKASHVPVGLKCSVLHDVASGLSFLHSLIPPLIHGSLSATNVFVTDAMVAKIGDIEMSQILSSSTPTLALGTSAYQPPEAMEGESRHNDVKFYMFLFGVVALFTLSQVFPKPLAPTFVDNHGKAKCRTELERRKSYMQLVLNQFSGDHPFVLIIQHCLNNCVSDRPAISQVIQWLEQARAQVDHSDSGIPLRELLQSKDEQIHQHQRMIEDQKKELDDCITKKDAQIESLEKQVQHLRATQKVEAVCSYFSQPFHDVLSPFH